MNRVKAALRAPWHALPPPRAELHSPLIRVPVRSRQRSAGLTRRRCTPRRIVIILMSLMAAQPGSRWHCASYSLVRRRCRHTCRTSGGSQPARPERGKPLLIARSSPLSAGVSRRSHVPPPPRLWPKEISPMLTILTIVSSMVSLISGLIAIHEGAWYTPDEEGIDRGGNPNTLTKNAYGPDGACCLKTCLTQVSKDKPEVK